MPLKPPRKMVRTVRQLIFWYYADLIAKAAGFDGNYGFAVSRFKKLDSGEMKWSSSIRDYQAQLEKGRVCIYCGATDGLTIDHIIPASRGGVDPRIRKLLESADNVALACRECNCRKADRDVFEWYEKDEKGELPKLVVSKFLKLAYDIHEVQGTLELEDPNMDGVLDIYDLGVVITHLISKRAKQVAK